MRENPIRSAHLLIICLINFIEENTKMADHLDHLGEMVVSPARQLLAVTPSDTINIPRGVRALYVGTGGNVSVLALDDTDPVVYKNVIAGTYLTVRALRVLATGTTAGDIVAEC